MWHDLAIFESFGDIVFAKVAQISIDFLGYFEKHPLKVKNAVAAF